MKKLGIYVLCICMILSMGFGSQTVQGKTVLTGKTAMEISKLMGTGWNLGNTFDATGKSSSGNVYSHETYWGNPKVTDTLIKGVKAAGFNTIRIPVTWYTELDSNYKINSEYMARVKEVVNMAISQDMFVILNVHHEKWVNSPTIATTYTEIGYELSAVWSQIASEFASFDQHLIFEGMNEPRKVGAKDEWSGDESSYQAVNYLNQVFVTTVRNNTSGYNQERCLMLPQYAASSSGNILSAWTYPTAAGKDAGNIMVSVHCYAPYNFCLSDTQKTFSASKAADTAEINSLFETLDNLFLANGIPVVIGETSATNSGNNNTARAEWAKYMGKKSAAYGVPIVLWDNGVNGTSGGECHSYINRTTGKIVNASFLDSLFAGYKSVGYASARKKSNESVSSLIDASPIWADKNGVTGTEWKAAVTLPASPAYFINGVDLAVVYTGDSAPVMVLDSEKYQQWWMPVNPSSTKTVNGVNVAYFTKSKIDEALTSANVKEYSALRNLMIVPTGSSKLYELSQVGNYTAFTCVINGKIASTDDTVPSNVTYPNMTFLGWYTTPDYKEGTKYNGEKLTGSVTLYAKFAATASALSKDNELPFVDVTKKAWYYSNLKYAYENDIIKGLDDTHFGPNKPMTRYMVVTVLYRGQKEPAVDTSISPFPDVPYKVNAWYFKPVAWAKANDVVGGYKTGKFGGNDNIIRQDFMKIIYSYAKLIGVDTSVKDSNSYKAVADYASVSKYAVESMNWGYENGFIGNNSLLKPKATITRAEATTILSRFLQKIGK